jgi:tRNA pseudouridine38-40 synthase
MPSFRLTLAYDGTDFAGSQVQPRQRTVQGELERVLAEVARTAPRTAFAGRTDSGVHAFGQVAAARLSRWNGSADELTRALEARLPRDVAVLAVEPCADAFDPRREARWREYRYWIAPGRQGPFLARWAWPLRADADVAAMAEAATLLLGPNDFASFASGGEGVPWSDRARRPRGTVRTVYRCDCREVYATLGPGAHRSGRIIEVRVTADGFLPRMVRNVVGALIEVGQGRRDAEWLAEVLAARDRRAGAGVAPPQGLTLWRVGFGDDLPDDD